MSRDGIDRRGACYDTVDVRALDNALVCSGSWSWEG